MVDEAIAPQVIETVIDTATEIQALKDGLLEIAREVGKLKAKVKIHVESPDAHHPALVKRDEN